MASQLATFRRLTSRPSTILDTLADLSTMTDEEKKVDTTTTAVPERDPAGESDDDHDDDDESEQGDEEEDEQYQGGERGMGDATRAKPGKKPNGGKKPGKKPNKPKPNNPRENALRKEFMLIDVDNSGFINEKDLSKACGGYIPESFFKTAIKVADTNKDGKVSFEEYKAIRALAKSMKEAALGKVSTPDNNNGKI